MKNIDDMTDDELLALMRYTSQIEAARQPEEVKLFPTWTYYHRKGEKDWYGRYIPDAVLCWWYVAQKEDGWYWHENGHLPPGGQPYHATFHGPFGTAKLAIIDCESAHADAARE